MSKEYLKSFDYELKQPVNIDVQGKAVDVYSLKIFAPNNQVWTDVNKLDVEFSKARRGAMKESSESLRHLSPAQLKSISKRDDKEEKKEEPKPFEVIQDMITFGSDMNTCYMALKDILSAGNIEKPMCLIDNEKMTATIFNMLSNMDTKEILGRYILNFLDFNQNT